ncbi:MAG: nicotinate-nucleotide adenylyltransferase [Candidatus Polarisedimenticolaceae bacterium]|nr:nicotinate-nucleotide adenylyltransferase [Candidatus Polarisedimenticolaceae bacterium]
MLGILGGTFDPIHFGHLRPALEVQQALGLEEVRLIPLRDPPHRNRPQTTDTQRLSMLQAAIKGLPGFRIDRQELERKGKSYTVETLRALRKEVGGKPICLLMGSDAFGQFHTWHKPGEILQLAHLIVMQRPGDSISPATDNIVESAEPLTTTAGGYILFQPVTQLDISSTSIRALIRNNLSPRYLLPDEVLAFIQTQKLYQ